MPKIPTYLASLDYRPARGGVSTAGASGRALAAFGETVGAFGEQIAEGVKKDQLAERARQAAAENERSDATAQYLNGLMENLHRDIEDFKTSTSFESIIARNPLRIDAIQQEIEQNVHSPAAQHQIMADVNNLADIQRPIIAGEHLHQQSNRARTNLPANLAIYAKAAIAARHPLEFDHVVDLAEREIWGKAREGFFTEEEAGRLEQGFYGDLARRQAEGAIAADPEGALAALEGGKDFLLLAEDARARLIGEASRAVQAQAVHRETETAARRRDLRSQMPGYLNALRDGAAPDEARFGRDGLIAALGEEEGDRHWAAIESAQAAGAAMAAVKWASPEEAAKQLAAVVGVTERSSVGDLAQAVAQRDERLWSKPADFVLTNPRVAELHEAMLLAGGRPQAPADLAGVLQIGQNTMGGGAMAAPASGDDDRRTATAAYANATLAEQERLGLPEDRRQILPESMAGDLAARLAGEEPAQADRSLRDLAADWGENWPRALNDLARRGLPGEYRLLARLDDPVARQGFAKVLTAQTGEPGTLRAKAGGVAEAIDEMIAALEIDQTEKDSPAQRQENLETSSWPNQGDERTFLESALPSVDPGDAGDRADAIQNARRRLGRHGRWLPPRPKALPFVTNTGEPIMLMNERGQMERAVIPEGRTLSEIVSAGETLGALSKSNGDYSLSALAPLMFFSHGMPWDLQRINAVPGVIHDEFRPVSSAAIGAYGAAAGLSFEELMNIQVIYGKIFGRWNTGPSNKPKEKISTEYPPLPESNVRNTKIGYDLQKAGKLN